MKNCFRYSSTRTIILTQKNCVAAVQTADVLVPTVTRPDERPPSWRAAGDKIAPIAPVGPALKHIDVQRCAARNHPSLIRRRN